MNEKKGFKAWLNERFPLSTFGYEVPPHANTLLFSLGGITMLSVIVLIITGFILTQFYSPNPALANQSIRILMTQVKLGSLIRSIHVWAAQIAVASIILHLLRALFYGSYKKPREINWIFGVVLFALMIGLFFTGTVIKWDQEGYEALSHTIAIGQMLGGPFATYLAPNDASLLSKFFSLHTSILPMILLVALVFHLFLVKMLKISPLPWEPKKKSTGKHTFFQHFYKLGGYFFILLGLLIALAILFPASIGPLPLKGIESTRPAWPFMAIFSIENWVGIPGLVYGAATIIIVLLLVPLLDRTRTHMFKDRKGVVAIASLVTLLLVGLTINAYLTKPKQHIGMGGGESTAQTTQGAQSTPQTINKAIGITEQLKVALTKKDIKAAKVAAETLDSTLDPLKDAIKDKDADLVNSLDTDSLLDTLKDTSPDFVKAASLTDTINQGLQKAKAFFPTNSSSDKINEAMALVGQIKSAVKAKNFKSATDTATTLDQTLDPLKDAIQAKKPDLVNALDTDGLLDKLKDTSPNTADINSILEAMTNSLSQAKSLLAVNAASSNPIGDAASQSAKLTTAMGMVDLIKNAVKDNDMVQAQALANNLDQGLDPLKDAIQAKNPDLVQQLATDSLMDMLKDSKPNISKINNTLDTMNQAIAQAVKILK